MADDRNANVVLTADTSNYSQQMTSAQSSTNAVVDSVTKLLDSLDRLTKNAGRKLEIISVSAVAGITAAAVAAGRLESQMSTLQATAAITGRTMNTANAAVDNLRRTLPISTEAVVGLVTALGKMGVSNQNVEKLASTFVKLGAATGEDINGLAQGMISLQRAMGTTEGSTTKFASTVAGLSANLGVSATGILQFSQSLAPVARTVGMTQTEVMGLSAAFLKSGQDGYAAANATVKMITDISRATRYGSADLSMYANLVGKTTTEFAKMGSTDQLQALFSAINKSGPDSIKILERMGLDGPRALKAIQGLAQSGNLQSSLQEAQRAFNGDDLEKGSKAAMDGFNDSLTRLRNNMTSMAQEFGKIFLPALTGVTKMFEGLTVAVRSAIQPITAIIAAMGLAGAGGAGIAGIALSNIGMLGAAAAGLMLMRSSLRAGMVSARGIRPGTGDERLGRSIASLQQGRGSWFQQRMFQAGNWLGGRLPNAAGPNMPRNIFGRLMTGTSALYQGGMNLARGTVQPLTAAARRDLTERTTGPRADMRGAWAAVRTGQGASTAAAMRGAVVSTTAFARALVGATVGVTQMGAAAARTALVAAGGAAARNVVAGGLGGIARAGQGLLGAVGGVPGLAIMGAIMGGSQVFSSVAEGKAQSERLMSNAGEASAVNEYASSLGLAGSAAMSFAQTLNKAEKTISVDDDERARSVRAEDVKAANTPGRELTNKNIAGMDVRGASAYANSILGTTGIDPNITQALKLDLIDEFGADAAKNIMANNQNYNIGDIVGNEDEGAFAYLKQLIKPSDDFRKSIEMATDATKIQAGELYNTYGAGESGKFYNVAVNQMLQKMEPSISRSGITEVGRGIEGIVGGNLDLSADDLERLRRTSAGTARREAFEEIIQESSAGKDFLESVNPRNRFDTSYRRPDTEPTLNSIERGIRRTMAGALARGDEGISNAISQPANENLNLQQAVRWGNAITTLTGSTSGAIEEFQRLRGTTKDLGSDMALAADLAIQAVQRVQRREMAFATPAQRGDLLVSNLRTAYRSNTADSAKQVIEAEDAVTTAEIEQGDRYRNIVRAYREFEISATRQQVDFDKQRSRQQTQYNLQRSRGDADYALSRRRQDDDYFTQLERGEFQYQLSRKQGQDDFDKSRRRAEADYQHQVAMMARQTAMSISDIYTRITTQPTWDANNLLSNANDQLGRMNQQQADLGTLRGMGVSGDVIEMMGLNDFQNQQQLARFVADLASDPSLVDAFNKNIAGKLDMGKAFATDQDSDAWKEMQRGYNLSMSRSLEDYELMQTRSAEAYERSIRLMGDDYAKTVQRGADDYAKMLERQNADYQTSVSQTVEDWATQMERARTDLNRSFEDVTGTFLELQTEALGNLSGAAAAQMNDIASRISTARQLIETEAENAGAGILAGLTPLFGNSEAAQAALQAAAAQLTTQSSGGGGGGRPAKVMADGGHVDGYSPHPRADNIPAMLTAGEYVQPVSTTEYYGADVMEAMRSKKIPKWAVQGFASGGLVEFGRMLQGMGFRVGEHPLFGGVNPVHMKNSLHYSGRAIDVNYGPGGTSLVEQQAIDRIVGLAKGYGLSTIWRAPNHFNHAHFDTGNYSKIGSSTTIGNNPTSGGGGGVDIGAIMRGKSIKDIESTMTGMPSAGFYTPGSFTNALGTLISKAASVEPDAGAWHGQGAIFSGAQRIGVGESGSEMVLPLNHRGADFLAETMNRFNPSGLDRVRGGQVVETRTVTYQQHFDQSTDINGPITVVAQDPNEMARRLDEKARMDRLRGWR